MPQYFVASNVLEEIKTLLLIVKWQTNQVLQAQEWP